MASSTSMARHCTRHQHVWSSTAPFHHRASLRLARPHRRSTPCTQATQDGAGPSTSGTEGRTLPFAATLTVLGAVLGTALDGIHSKDGLQVYGAGLAVDWAGLKTSLAVPPLLALFYVVLGALVLAGDALAGSEDATTREARERARSPAFVALCFGVLAAVLQLSAWAQGPLEGGGGGWAVPQLHLVLGACCAGTWAALDRTRQTLFLCALCGLGAPAAEVLLNSVLLPGGPLWTYPHADLHLAAGWCLGAGRAAEMVSWVPWCYASYVPALAALARHLWQRPSGK